MTTPGNAEASAEGDAGNPDSPAFDESFAMEAQLVLGGLITPATALRPDAAQYTTNPPLETQVCPLFCLLHKRHLQLPLHYNFRGLYLVHQYLSQ